MSVEEKTQTPPATNAASPQPAPSGGNGGAAGGVDLGWVWREVRKRVFIKLPFSLGLADAMEAAIPIILDGDHFVCGLTPRHYPLANHLNADQVRNTIENILRQAAGRRIQFEVIEGTSLEDWEAIRDRRNKAHEAVIAMAEQKVGSHQFDDILNQIVAEIRHRIVSTPDRIFPQVRMQLLLDLVPSLADAEDMLFPDPDTHEARRAMARTFDRIAGFLETPPATLALEVERYRREHRGATAPKSKPMPSANRASGSPAS